MRLRLCTTCTWLHLFACFFTNPLICRVLRHPPPNLSTQTTLSVRQWCGGTYPGQCNGGPQPIFSLGIGVLVSCNQCGGGEERCGGRPPVPAAAPAGVPRPSAQGCRHLGKTPICRCTGVFWGTALLQGGFCNTGCCVEDCTARMHPRTLPIYLPTYPYLPQIYPDPPLVSPATFD